MNDLMDRMDIQILKYTCIKYIRSSLGAFQSQ
jgi:hypothetical protein